MLLINIIKIYAMHQLLCKKEKIVPKLKIPSDMEPAKETIPFIMQEDAPMFFPKTEINPFMLKLQVIAREFLTTVIIHHELLIYNIIVENGYDTSLLTTTNKTIIDLIIECTKTFYNNCYMNLQNKVVTSETTNILEMSYYAQYSSPHILINKLIKLTLDIHIDIIRENLSLKSVEQYFSGIQGEIEYQFLSSVNLAHVMSKGFEPDEDFINVSDGEKPFDVIIDKHIEQ